MNDYIIWSASDSSLIKRAVLARDVGDAAKPACSRLAGIDLECENFWGQFVWCRCSAVQDDELFEIVEHVEV